MSRTGSGTEGGQGTAKAATEKVKPAAKRTAKLSREQFRYLEGRIAMAVRDLRKKMVYDQRKPEPLKVKQAQKVVNDWEKRQAQIENQNLINLRDIERTAKEALLFQTPEEAFKAVIALEKKAGQK